MELVGLREAIRQRQAQENVRQAVISSGASPYNSELEKFFDLLKNEAEPKGVQGRAREDERTDVDALRRLKAQLSGGGGLSG